MRQRSPRLAQLLAVTIAMVACQTGQAARPHAPPAPPVARLPSSTLWLRFKIGKPVPAPMGALAMPPTWLVVF